MPTTRRLSEHDRERALAVLADSPDGQPDATMMVGHSFTAEQLAKLVKAELVTAYVRPLQGRSTKAIKVTWLMITDAGRQALATTLSARVGRKELTDATWKEMREKIKVERMRLADVKPSRGGRGKRGGMREAARQMGVPRSTARDRQREAKGGGNDVSRHVSDQPAAEPKPAAPLPAPATPLPTLPTRPTALGYEMVKACTTLPRADVDAAAQGAAAGGNHGPGCRAK
jgi:hypothetical protein